MKKLTSILCSAQPPLFEIISLISIHEKTIPAAQGVEDPDQVYPWIHCFYSSLSAYGLYFRTYFSWEIEQEGQRKD
jgi:hypothetical protein